ncbi:MAG: glutathione S-transferase N-terminal domain-containing protein [Myxococcales bacterium]|nr:glutathione S-transferase N-terminal domain-containing protein [Myxococcales bacterium]
MSSAAVLRSVLASSAAAWRGTDAYRHAARTQPAALLELYEFESCPFCRLVREALTELDLDALIYPCPKQGARFRPTAVARGGAEQFPYLVDPNTGRELYESAAIIDYLAETYGGRASATRGLRRQLRVLSSTLASAFSGGRGIRVAPSRAPAEPLVLFSFESSPFSRLVRERLCELELPYVLRNAGKASAYEYGPPAVRDKLWKRPMATGRNRRVLAERTGKVQVPYLIDPNTGAEMYESAAIVAYLDETYAL